MVMSNKIRYRPSTIILGAYPQEGHRGLEPVRADMGQEAGYSPQLITGLTFSDKPTKTLKWSNNWCKKTSRSEIYWKKRHKEKKKDKWWDNFILSFVSVQVRDSSCYWWGGLSASVGFEVRNGSFLLWFIRSLSVALRNALKWWFH